MQLDSQWKMASHLIEFLIAAWLVIFSGGLLLKPTPTDAHGVPDRAREPGAQTRTWASRNREPSPLLTADLSSC